MVSVAPRRLADAEREVTGGAAHRDHHVPASRRLGIGHQVPHDVHADRPGGLVAEGVDLGREIEIVVDGLRDVRHRDPALRLLTHPVGRVGGVVATDGDELVDAAGLETRDHPIEVLLPAGRIRPRDPEHRAASIVHSTDVLDLERTDRIRITHHQPREAVHQTEDREPLEPRSNGGRGDHRVDARGGSATGEDAEPSEASMAVGRHCERALSC